MDFWSARQLQQLQLYDRVSCSSAVEPARNAIIGRGLRFCHEAVFGNFTSALIGSLGELTDPIGGQPLVIDWLGVRYEREVYCHMSYYRQRVAHALRVEVCDLLEWLRLRPSSHSLPLRLPLPLISEEYFEYVDVLESVVSFFARRPRRNRIGNSQRPYRIVEVGAGFGMWSLAAHAALRQFASSRDAGHRVHASPHFEAHLVEADPLKIVTIKDTLARNNISDATIYHAALAPPGHQGQEVILGGHLGFYAVHSLPGAARSKFSTVVNSTDLLSLLLPLRSARADDMGLVDLLDVDVQGAEHTAFDEATMDALDSQVLRVHIGTHGKGTKNKNAVRGTVPGTAGARYTGEFNESDATPLLERLSTDHVYGPADGEKAIAQRFIQHGWRPRWLLGQNAGNCDHDDLFRVTPLGYVCMADGALAFVNPRYS